MSDQQEWIDVEEPSLTTDEVTEVQDAVDQLGELESQVETTDDIAALEAYNYAFGLIKHYNQLGSSNGVSLESYNSHKSKKQHLVTSIRNQKELVKKHLTVALEAYVKNAPDELSNVVDKYNLSVDKINNVVEKINTIKNKEVSVDSTRIWDMFHVDGKLITDAEEAIDEEVSKLKEISTDLKHLADGKNYTSDSVHYMMFNRKMVLTDNGISIETGNVPEPKKSFSTGQKTFIVIASLLFAPLGFGYAKLADRKNSEAVTNKDILKLKAFVSKVEKLDNIVETLCGIVNKLSSDKNKDNKDKHAVISSCTVLIKHITEITNGVYVMLGKLENK